MTLFGRLSKAVSANLEKAGIYEHSSHYILSSQLNKNSLVIDLGANVGNFYTLMHKRYGCTFYAVEPSPQLYNALPATPGVSAYNYAVGGHNGNVTFYLSNESEANSTHTSIAETWGITETLTVPMITLEKFIKDQNIPMPIDLVKIDIEGAEVDVINTLPDDMLRKIKQIPIEFHDFLGLDETYIKGMHAAISKLKSNGFKVVRLSAYDYRAVLCFNTKLIPLNANQKFRLNILHPVLLSFQPIHSALSRFLKGDKKDKK